MANQNIPKLRFKGFEGEWSVKLLKDVFLKVNERNVNNEYKNVLTNSAVSGIVNQLDFFDKDIANQNNLLNYYVVCVGDFIYNPRISKSAPVGPLNRNNLRKGIMSPLYTIIRSKEENSDFFEKYFQTKFWHKYMYKIANYGARFDRMSIATNDFFKMPLYFPNINEQQKIASFLGKADEWIGNLKEQKEDLEKYKKGMMQKIFAQKIRFKGFNGDWKKEKLGNLFKERNERCGDLKLQLLSVSLGNGITKQDDSVKTDSSSKNKENYKIVYPNDIVYNTMRMWQGASGVSEFKGITSPAYTIITLNDGEVNFFKYFFKQPRTIFDFYRYSQGLTSDTWNLKYNHFSEIDVITPKDVKEQQKIAEFLTSIDKLIDSKQEQIAKAEEWKKGLMQGLFV